MEALFKSAGAAGFRCLCYETLVVPRFADHVNLAHPVNGSPEEGSTGVATVTSKVQMVRSRGIADVTVQG